MYYIRGENQESISEQVGVTRSMVSRMLSEARELGMVKVQVERPTDNKNKLSELLCKQYNLKRVEVVDISKPQSPLSMLGKVAARVLIENLQPGMTLGSSWGAHLSAVVDNIYLTTPIPQVKVVQLMGAMHTGVNANDGFALVYRLAEKLNGHTIYLNSPYLVDDPVIANGLLENTEVKRALEYGKNANLALMGISTNQMTSPTNSAANYGFEEEIRLLTQLGAVGNVCGLFYDQYGQIASPEFQQRTIGISKENLKNIPTRIGVTGGPERILPILGALRGGFINVLVTDTSTAQAVLQESASANALIPS
ncbi:MAG: sugar-binding transcriptional regulator [Anaerolineaceae bacterium]